MNIFDTEYGYDKKLAKGNWFTIKSIPVKLAYMQEIKITEKVAALRAKKREQVNRDLTFEEHAEIGEKIFIEDVLLDWKIDDFPYTVENASEIIRKYPVFLQDCMVIIDDNKRFQEKEVKETVKK